MTDKQFPDLRGLAYRSIDQAVTFLRQDGRLLLPFIVTEVGSELRLRRFAAPTLEAGLANARQTLRSEGPFDRATLVWDGYYTSGGQKSDAVLIEAFEAGEAHGLYFAQPYEKTGTSPNLIEPFGNVKLLSERAAPLF